MRRGWRLVVSVAASLLTCGIVALWLRSYSVLDELSIVNADGRTFAAVSFQGALHVSRAGDRAAQRPLGWDTCSIPPDSDWGAIYRLGQVDWEWLGFAQVSGTSFITAAPAPPPAVPSRPLPQGIAAPGAAAATTAPAPFAVRQGRSRAAAPPGRTFAGTGKIDLVPWLMSPPYVSLVVPYWAIALLLTPLLALAPVRAMKRRWRRRRGLCADCGYDLRASAGRCPECGTGVVGEAASRATDRLRS